MKKRENYELRIANCECKVGKRLRLFTFTLSLHLLFSLHLAATAAVPLRWTVETSRATPAQFEAYQGETLALEADLQSHGKPLEPGGIAALFWQTNGMGSAYWEATAAVSSNRLSAVWTPEMDVGAKSYNCFIGVPGTVYHAAFQLRLRPSPGADPNTLPLPVPVIDFAKVRVLNPPWGSGGGGVDTNAVEVIANKAVETNALTRALAARTGADITTGGNYRPFGHTDPANNISYNIMQLDYGLVDTGDRIDELVDEAWEAFALKEESVANQDGEANDLTVYGLTANYDARFNDNVYIGPNSLYIDGRLIEDVFSGYTPRRIFDDLKGEFEAHRDNANIHVTASEKAAWNAKLSPSDVIDPASATVTGKAADALKVKEALANIPAPYTPPNYLRVYDETRQCWWIGRMVDGTLNWEVE